MRCNIDKKKKVPRTFERARRLKKRKKIFKSPPKKKIMNSNDVLEKMCARYKFHCSSFYA